MAQHKDSPAVLQNYFVPLDRLYGHRMLLGSDSPVLAPVFIFGGFCLIAMGPNQALQIIGWVAVVFGGMYLDGFIRAIGLLIRWWRLSRQFPNQPWAKDYLWDPTGQTDSALGMTIRYAIFGISMFMLSNITTLVTIGGRIPATPANIGYCVLGFLISLVFLYFLFIRKSWHYLKFGASRLIFQRIPYVLGEPFEAQLIPDRSIRAYKKMQFTLRCIQLAAAPDGPLAKPIFNPRGHSWPQVMHADRVELENGSWLKGMPPLTIKFPLPDKRIPTSISAPMASMVDTGEINPRPLGRRYWELEVRASVPGMDYKAAFLVPIYDR